MLFSQRKGLKSVKNVIQTDFMDLDLRAGLWNVLSLYCWETMKQSFVSEDKRIETVCKLLWIRYFKQTVDSINAFWPQTLAEIKKYFFECQWYEVYDFIEIFVEISEVGFDTDNIINAFNSVLKQELSAYRFVGKKIVQITSQEEISAIEEALERSEPLKPVYTHLNASLNLLADRKSPDYRNSIKESISAVEAMCRIITNNHKASLGEALKKVKDNGVILHPALEKSFTIMYGYASDASGIRHSLLKESNLKFIDGKFMLVSCSAFVNFLIEKASEAGIKF